MSRCAIALLALALAIPARAQDADKVGKDKAPVVAKKAVAEALKKKSAAITEVANVTVRDKIEATFEGVLRKDLAAVKGTAEVYAKSAAYLVHSGDKFEPPEALRGHEAAVAATFKNPAVILNDLGRLSANASYLEDGTLDGKSCKVIHLTADEPLLEQHIKDISQRTAGVLKEAAQGLDFGNITGYFDKKTSVSSYKMWVDKATLLVCKIEWEFKPVIKKESLPPGVPLIKLEALTTIQFSKWDETVAFDIPAPIRAKWNLK